MTNLALFDQILGHSLGQKATVTSTNEASKELLILKASQHFKKIVIVVPSPKDMTHWGHFFTLNQDFLSQVKARWGFLPALSPWSADKYINQTQFKVQRLMGLALLSGQESGKSYIVTHPTALRQRTYSPEAFRSCTLHLTTHQKIDQDDLIEKLRTLGYVESKMVEEEGCFSVKGSIVDLFSPSYEDPIRIELLDDDLVSMRRFSVETQKTIGLINDARVVPAHEYALSDPERKAAAQRLHDYLSHQNHALSSDRDGLVQGYFSSHRSSQLDFFAPIIGNHLQCALDYCDEDTLVVLIKGQEQTEHAWHEQRTLSDHQYKEDVKSSKAAIEPHRFFDDLSQLSQKALSLIEFSARVASEECKQFIVSETPLQGIRPSSKADTRFDDWLSIITNHIKLDHCQVNLLCSSSEQEERLETLLANRDLSCAREAKNLSQFLKGGKLTLNKDVVLGPGYLSDAVWCEADGALIVPEHLLFGVTKKKVRSSSARLKNYISSFSDLKIHDLVVYEDYGIGKYMGLVTLEISGAKSDFLHIQYFGTDKIYLPVDRLGSLQRYSSGNDGDHHVTLDKLGSGNWEKRRGKVKQAVKEMAEKLLRIQAQRALANSHTYAKPSDDYFKFESEFPYDETEDQLKAIEEVNHDLETSKQMDRLICGDVGFGKTEVALRAAFRSVHEGYQVLVLVPTTILCYQHYRSFYDRMNRHGIRVGQLNRFVPNKIAAENIRFFSEGKLDILIGTHKLLNDQLKARRLGLIVIDEEQRFGVSHKERLKELKANADILTLTATPIPRTLHMAMLGLRDISIIATPPPNRLSVRTFVATFDESLIRNAIENECLRGGQVFFVHNRVEDIHEVAAFVKSLYPKAEVRVGHGQMKENELEQVIIDFIEQKFQVLVCTTIIESGVDMPNVNTIIINDADRFGLAQLYQMRGRVGRSSVQAYAYLLTKDPGRLTDEAQKRLEVIATHQSLGSGFQIASHDLEIRGAGNLLGADQSGHASDVGLEMYTDMLSEAIQELQGQAIESIKVDTEVKLSVNAMIPAFYIVNEGQRLQIYKNLFSAESLTEIDQTASDMTDQFGPAPEEALRLVRVGKIKFMLSQIGAKSVTLNKSMARFEVKFARLKESTLDKLIQFVQKSPGSYRLSPDYSLNLFWNKSVGGSDIDKADDSSVLEVLYTLSHQLFVEVTAP